MDDFDTAADPASGSHKLPVVVIVNDHVLPRSCIVNILKRELVGFEIAEMGTTRDLNGIAGREVRLIAFDMGDADIADPSVEDGLVLIEKLCPQAHVALLSNRDDEATATAALRRGIRGFLPSSIPVEVAVAGLRLVLAGGVYRPLPIVSQNKTTNIRSVANCTDNPELPAIRARNGLAKLVPEQILVDLTPREQHVLAALKLGLPNKLIAVRLNLSENTVKMHIQHIMRKCRARNRTEAVLRWSGRTNGHLPS
jgi:DNA-binding NarL/FixJ family response regulator